MPIWNPDQYLKFNEERTRPAMDLCERIPLASPAWILDVGCGPGNSTEVLRERWPSALIQGLDNSPEMLERARASHPDGDWILADAATYEAPAPFDIVFSNAALQWLPDHEHLLPRLLDFLAPGGVLAVQVPNNGDSPLWRCLRNLVLEDRWRHLLAGTEGAPAFRGARAYHDLLAPLCKRVDLWETIYYHGLASHQAMLDWFEGTGLRPYLQALPDDDAREAFKGELLETCRGHYPPHAGGGVLFPFRRLFFVAWK